MSDEWDIAMERLADRGSVLSGRDRRLIRDALSERDAAREQLAKISDTALRQLVDWMHLHELAMSDPFACEAAVHRFIGEIRALAEYTERSPAE